jgi:hypothetical protein
MSENEKVEMGNVVIPPHHQSAPKAHPADQEIMKAAREIDEGNWIPAPDPNRPEAMDGLGLALGLGSAGVAVGDKPALEEFQHTENYDLLGRHPRVMEALERMRHEVYNPPDPVAALEHTFALRELATESSKPQCWDRQGRWEGKENEAMRYGQILTPEQFYDRLGKVVGKGRIKLGEHLVRTSPTARSGRIGLFVRNPAWKGSKTAADERPWKIGRLRTEGEAELVKARQLRRLGRQSEADKKVDLAGQMAQEAMRLRWELNTEAAIPELLRVGTLQWPVGTEWMIMSFTAWGAVHAAKFIGWRTALLTMIRCKAITEKEAHKAFPVPSGPAAAWYLEQLQMLREEEGTVQ